MSYRSFLFIAYKFRYLLISCYLLLYVFYCSCISFFMAIISAVGIFNRPIAFHNSFYSKPPNFDWATSSSTESRSRRTNSGHSEGDHNKCQNNKEATCSSKNYCTSQTIDSSFLFSASSRNFSSIFSSAGLVISILRCSPFCRYCFTRHGITNIHIARHVIHPMFERQTEPRQMYWEVTSCFHYVATSFTRLEYL